MIKMFRFIFQEKSLGVFYTKNGFEAAKITKFFNSIEIEFLKSNVKRLDISQKDIVSSTLPFQDLFIKHIEIPLTKEKSISSVVPYQVEPFLPYPIEEAILTYSICSKNKTSSDVLVYSINKKKTECFLKNLKKNHIYPDNLIPFLEAFNGFFQTFSPSKKPSLIIHMMENKTVCVFIRDKKVLNAFSFPLGEENFIKTIAKDKKESEEQAKKTLLSLNFLKIKELKQTHKLIDQYALEVKKVCYTLEQQGFFVEQNLITGLGAYFNNLDKALGITNLAPIIPLKQKPKEIKRFALSLGLAIEGLKEKGAFFTPSFISQQFTKKRLKTPLTLFSILSIFTAFSLLIYGKVSNYVLEKKVKTKYAKILALNGKPLPKNLQNLNEVSLEDILNSIKAFQKDQLKIPSEYPLKPKVPLVKDVLAWLATHPAVIENGKNKIKIESFSYKMVSLPTQKSKNEKYRVLVDIEFTAETPTDARAFHNSLLNDNEIIDTTKEIKWSATKTGYRAGFTLKDKTKYRKTRR